jgi:hypothetical protein
MRRTIYDGKGVQARITVPFSDDTPSVVGYAVICVPKVLNTDEVEPGDVQCLTYQVLSHGTKLDSNKYAGVIELYQKYTLVVMTFDRKVSTKKYTLPIKTICYELKKTSTVKVV